MKSGSRAFVSVKNWVYVLGDGDQLEKFVGSSTCLYLTDHTNPDLGYDFGEHIWYSYDGSRIFLDNGLTLTASSDSDTDMEVHGDFNSSYAQYSYTWFAQSGNFPYLIAGLRTYISGTLNFYSWPYLQPNGTRPIPLPTKNAIGIYKSEQVHYCLENSVLVFSVYELLNGVFETGIAYIDI